MNGRTSEVLQTRSLKELDLENRRLREDLEVFRTGFESVSGREVLLREILDHTPFGVMIRDRSGRILDCNRKICELLACHRERLLGVEGYNFLAADSVLPFPEQTDWGCGLAFDMELVRSDGGICPARCVSHGIEREGQMLQVVYILDMSAFREREEALKVSAFTDGLTGVWNRTYFQGRLLEEMERVRRYGSFLSLILFDIDHFKDFNDRFGHSCGDSILKRLAELVGSTIRVSDCFSRWGGDEFLIFTPVESMAARAFAERLRVEVRDSPWPMGVALTLSLGVVEFLNEELPAEVLLDRADQAMYRAKREGGDRVCVWSRDFLSSGFHHHGRGGRHLPG